MTKCDGCHEFEATFIIEKGKRIIGEFELLETFRLCEMCLLDYEHGYKNINIPYRIKTIKEKVQFT